MQTPFRWVSSIVTIAFVTAAPLVAQHPQVRKGFWIGFGFGWGSLGVSCSGCPSIDRRAGAVGHLRMGGTLKPNLLLGGDVVGWSKTESGTTVSAGNVTFSGYYYPMVESGLFVTGGVGASTYNESASGNNATATGIGFTIGAGYDIRVARNFSITPVGHFLWGAPGDLQLNGTTITPGVKINQFDFGLNATFH